MKPRLAQDVLELDSRVYTKTGEFRVGFNVGSRMLPWSWGLGLDSAGFTEAKMGGKKAFDFPTYNKVAMIKHT